MIRNRAPFWLLAAAGLAVAGCSSRPEPIKPRTTQTVTLDGEKKLVPVKTKLFEQITLELPPIKVRGYRWQLFSHDARVFQQVTEVLPPTSPERGPTVAFIAIHVVDRSLMRFLLLREGAAKESLPVDSQDLILSVGE